MEENKVFQVKNLNELETSCPELFHLHHLSLNKQKSEESDILRNGKSESDIDKERRLVQHHISSREFQRSLSLSQQDIDRASLRRDSISSASPRQVFLGHFASSADELQSFPNELEETRISHLNLEGKAMLDRSIMATDESEGDLSGKPTEAGKLIEEEEREEGAVSFSVYWAYIKACTIILSLLVILLHLGHTGSKMATDFWLSAWSSAGSARLRDASNYTQTQGDEDQLRYYLTGYIALGTSTVVLALFVAFICELGGLIAAVRFHRRMLQTVLYAPMRFFDTTPIGRILNRFSGDTFILDDKLPRTIEDFFRTTLLCAAAMLVNAVAAPYFLLVAVPIIFIYYFLQKFYRASSRELARLDSISKSPIVSHFTETLWGISTIRAFGDASRFQNKALELIDTNASIFLWLNTCNRWLGVRLDHLGAVVVFAAAVCTTTMACNGAIPSGMVGLGISYALMMAHYLNWVIRLLTDAEMQMNAVERVVHYTELKVEKNTQQTKMVDKTWPQRGEIRFDNVALRYAEHLSPVVKNIHLVIKPGTKLGICGRTGSGKSSLTLGLFRLNDVMEGTIKIDDVDISQISLETLRSRLSIIPQDPILFSGSIRYNLDPDGENPDEEIWKALEIAQLKSTIQQIDGQLDASVEEGGSNFSVGQRQLFCLARAFLRDSRIVVMDEATASVDMATDKLVQDVLHLAFQERTVLTIAHRVATILDYDEIVVLDQGNIVEHDTPQNLMADHESKFYALVKKNK